MSEDLTHGALPPLVALRCDICKEYMKEPSTLPCLHSFCKSCLDTYNGCDTVEESEEEEEEEEEGDGAEKVVQKPVVKKEKPFCCPTCKDALHLPDYIFFSVPFRNERVARIIKLLQESKILCQNCESTASEYRCNVCDAYTCESCWKLTHSAPIFKCHTPERLTHEEMTCLPKCDLHPLNVVEYFCAEDEIGVCQVCLLKGEFKGKDYSLTQDVKAERLEEVEKGVSRTLLLRAQLLESRKENENTLASLSENLTAQQSKVRVNFASIRTALSAREDETLLALQRLHDAKKQVLDAQVEAIDGINRKIEDGVENINLVLNYCNPLELVYLTYVIQNAIRNLCDIPSTSPLGSFEKGSANHEPAVDDDLPVVLSDKVVDLIKAYASVPDSNLVEQVANGKASPNAISTVSGTKEQQKLLQQVTGTSVQAEEYGCIVQ